MRIRPDDMRMYQGWTLTRPAVLHGGLCGTIRGQEVRAIHLLPKQQRETLQQACDVTAGGLIFDGNRDREAVILDQKQNRQTRETGHVDGLPEFALAGTALASRYQ